jgi:hypothetical protein
VCNVLKEHGFWPVNYNVCTTLVHTDPLIKTFCFSINSHLQLGPSLAKHRLPCFGGKGLSVGKVRRGIAPAGISKTSYYE